MSELQHSARFDACNHRLVHALRACSWLCASMFACLWLTACGVAEPCAVPGVAVECACANLAPGARVCSAQRTLGECDCSGAIGLPNAVADGEGGTGAGTGAGTGGMSGSGAGGTGGMSMHKDSGVAMDSGATLDAGDMGPDTGPMLDPDLAYRACMSATDCDPDAQCVQTAAFPATVTVCAPACVNTTDCPVPSGMYDAVVACVTGFCRLDCTPVLFAPLLSCPTGMTCVAPPFGAAACYGN